MKIEHARTTHNFHFTDLQHHHYYQKDRRPISNFIVLHTLIIMSGSSSPLSFLADVSALHWYCQSTSPIPSQQCYQEQVQHHPVTISRSTSPASSICESVSSHASLSTASSLPQTQLPLPPLSPQSSSQPQHQQQTKRRAPSTKVKKICRNAACTNFAVIRGVCVKHGAKKATCSHPTCTNQVQRHGVCRRHGATKYACSHEGCTSQAQKMGVCKRHGANILIPKICTVDACDNQARGPKGLCYRHGAKKYKYTCSVEGCERWPKKGGLCISHNSKKEEEQSTNGKFTPVVGDICVVTSS